MSTFIQIKRSIFNLSEIASVSLNPFERSDIGGKPKPLEGILVIFKDGGTIHLKDEVADEFLKKISEFMTGDLHV